MTGSGKTYTIANVIQPVQKPTLVMAPNKTLAAQLYGEFRTFFPHNAVEYFVSYYDYYQPEAYMPSSDTYIEKDSSINEHIEQMRLSATKALLERPRRDHRRARCRRSTASAIPSEYHKMVLHMVRGERIDQRELIRRLAGDAVHAQRDGPARAAPTACAAKSSTCFRPNRTREAVRIELFDGEIEKLTLFDPLTGEIAAQGAALHDLSRSRTT